MSRWIWIYVLLSDTFFSFVISGFGSWVASVIMSWWIDVPYEWYFVVIYLFVSPGISGGFLERVRIWYPSLPTTTAGGVHNDVERILREDRKFSPDDIDAIRSSTSVEYICYCQSAFASTGSWRWWRWGSQRESARPARLQGFPHHDFVVVHLTAIDSEGKLCKLYISSEKEGKGQRGGTPGIYIKLLNERELQNLEANFLLGWDPGPPIQVPLDVLTTNLFEGHDTGYNLVNKNCWDYAKAACESVFLLLSQQPGVNPEQKRLLLGFAKNVRFRVFLRAKVEGIGTLSYYITGILLILNPITTMTVKVFAVIALIVRLALVLLY